MTDPDVDVPDEEPGGDEIHPTGRMADLIDADAVDTEHEILVAVYCDQDRGTVTSGVIHGETINGRSAAILASELESMRKYHQSMFEYIRSGRADADGDGDGGAEPISPNDSRMFQ